MPTAALDIILFGGAWTPKRLGPALLGWWDAEEAPTITQSGGAVSSWRDRVATYDAAQSTGASKPSYSATSFNGRPGITFDGVDDELSFLSTPFPTGANPSDIWALVDQTALAADTGNRAILSWGDGATNTNRTFLRGVSGAANRAGQQTGTGASSVINFNSSTDLSGRHVARGLVTASAQQEDVDGVAGASVGVVPGINAGRTRIGGNPNLTPGALWQGAFNTILVLNPPATTDQAAQILAYLKARGATP